MSAAVAEMDGWVKSVLGFDVAAARGGGTGEGKVAKPTGETGEKIASPEGETDEKGGVFAFAKRKVYDLTGLMAPSPKELSADVNDTLKELDDKIEAIEKLGFDVKRLKADRTDAANAGKKAESLTGDDRVKTTDKVVKRIEDLTKHAESLLKSAKSIMGASKDAPTDDQKSKIYQKALEDRYGLEITNPGNMPNTHLDKVFDMFATVPADDAKQDKLKKLEYYSGKGSGSYNKSSLTVKMGDFGNAKGTEKYEIDGEEIQANSFDATTLHEIGHAVDNKHGFMASNGSKSGCGAWKTESVDSITDVYLAEAKKIPGLTKDVDQAALKKAVKAALDNGDTGKPDEITQPDWEKIVDFLTAKCLPIRADKKPWWEDSKVVIGGRVYQQSYADGRWCSFEHAAIAKTKVNQYQWRAPGEWFAEVYAISWLTKKKPPSGVDASVLEFMWNG